VLVTLTVLSGSGFRPHRMYEVHTIAIDDPVVCQSVTRAGCAKMHEEMDILFGMQSPGYPRNVVLDGGLRRSHGKGERV